MGLMADPWKMGVAGTRVVPSEEPVALEPVTLEPAVPEPMAPEPVVLEPVAPGPACPEWLSCVQPS